MSELNIFPGIKKLSAGHQFAVWAPHAKAVALTGSFNDWDDNGIPLNQQDNGMWWCDVADSAHGDEYKYIITTESGERLTKNDPSARLMTNSVGNSVIYDDEFSWHTPDFTPVPIHLRVIYELHIGTFHRKNGERGTFDSAIEKLGALKSLGINIIELMPVNEFAGDISWGYNPACPFAVEEAYGGPDGLKRFIDAAHGMNMGVIMDVVYNHFGPSDLDIWQFDGWHENNKGGIYFYNDDRSTTPWGDTRPDYGREEVRSYIIDNALMWLGEFKADGLRMDMVPYMRSVSGADNGSDDIPEAYSLIKSINQHINERFPNKMTIAEDLHHHNFITDTLGNDGCGYTSQWDAAFVHPVRHVLTQASDDHVNLDEIQSALLKQYSQRPFARVIYTESHDEVANGKARLVEEIAPGNVDDDFFARQKGMLAATMVFTTAGVPMLFQGQEFKETGWFNDSDDLDWSRRDTFSEYVKAFTSLIALRNGTDSRTAGLTGGGTEIIHRDDAHNVIGFIRSNGHQHESVYVYLHFGRDEIGQYTLNGLPEHAKCVFAWSNGLYAESVSVSENALTLTPYGIWIFTAGQQH
ncbi:alpha-amylase family glycosyl hydrolase [Alteromonas sp. H39]|uniref:alpha-amylase family glycosyl hydrolase n=1 Tax=Alteromonas sp. H39 TaxID=3389876 RepID=UPI0039E02945